VIRIISIYSALLCKDFPHYSSESISPAQEEQGQPGILQGWELIKLVPGKAAGVGIAES
jgi:hypothetical protein